MIVEREYCIPYSKLLYFSDLETHQNLTALTLESKDNRARARARVNV